LERVVLYRFRSFTLSPRGQLLNGGREVALIPRYFDLLLLLVERRHEAVNRRIIFDAVWSDVVVSDGALTQAVRTLRRALGDDPREPSYIRTVSRHGYRFVYADVAEGPEGPPEPRSGQGEAASVAPPGVPIAFGRAGSASAGAALAGLGAGLAGGLLLRWAGGWNVPATVSVALGIVGAAVGAIGGLGVGGGLAVGESRGRRGPALLAFGALGGGAVGLAGSMAGRWTVEGLFGRPIRRWAAASRLAIGAAAGSPTRFGPAALAAASPPACVCGPRSRPEPPCRSLASPSPRSAAGSSARA
jgi:DNA-binding winged helix-turn-helix (wHTH) protein